MTDGAIGRTGVALQRNGVASDRTGGAIERSRQVLPLELAAAHTAGPLISQEDTRRNVCDWDDFALDENVGFTALRSLKKYDPGAQCGIEYYIIYCKFAHMQKCEFLIFGISVVQGQKCLCLL